MLKKSARPRTVARETCATGAVRRLKTEGRRSGFEVPNTSNLEFRASNRRPTRRSLVRSLLSGLTILMHQIAFH